MSGGWGVFSMFCRVCSYEWTAAAPLDGELDYCECPRCGHMTGQAPDVEDGDDDAATL